VHADGGIGNAYLHHEDAVKEMEENLANDCIISFIRTREVQE
jgi:hypothetical protein